MVRQKREEKLEELQEAIHREQAERCREGEESYQDFLLDAASYDEEVSTESDRVGEEFRPYVEDYDRDWWSDDKSDARSR